MQGRAWRRFCRSRFAVGAIVYTVLMATIALFAPLLANRKPLAIETADGWRFPAFADYGSADPDLELPAIASTRAFYPPVQHSPNSVDLGRRLEPPDASHRFGTDELGRDVLARMIHGARVSLLIGFVATALSLLVGSLLGAVAGYYGGAADWIVSRSIETILCFPFVFLVLAILALFEPSIYTIIIALGLTTWTTEARYMRAEMLKLREVEFTLAARANGAGDARIIFRHLLPNALAPVLVSASFGVAYAILMESALSFLGVGVPLPTATWGTILSAAREHIDYAWWLVVFPGLAIFTTVAAFNVIGERFRDALDPRSS